MYAVSPIQAPHQFCMGSQQVLSFVQTFYTKSMAIKTPKILSGYYIMVYYSYILCDTCEIDTVMATVPLQFFLYNVRGIAVIYDDNTAQGKTKFKTLKTSE